MHTLHQGDEKFVGGETLGPSGGGGGRQEKALEVFPGILGAGLSRAGPSGISRHLCSAQYTCKCADVAPSFQQRRVSTATERQSGQVRSRSSHRQRHSSQNTCWHRRIIGSRNSAWQMAQMAPASVHCCPVARTP